MPREMTWPAAIAFLAGAKGMFGQNWPVGFSWGGYHIETSLSRLVMMAAMMLAVLVGFRAGMMKTLEWLLLARWLRSGKTSK